MARPYRLLAEGMLYHITSRGNDRRQIFSDGRDRQKFLEYLKAAKEKFVFFLYAYCLMNNHYHLLIETTQANLSKIMQSLNTAYTVYCNVKRKRCGHLFQGRYKSISVDKDSYLLELTRYIHLNPVRAKLVDSPEKYKWSSYREYFNTNTSGLVDSRELFQYIDLTSTQYHNFVLKGLSETIPNPFSNVFAGFILGSTTFTKESLLLLKEKVEGRDCARKKEICGTEPDVIKRAVSEYYKQDIEVMRNSKKRLLLARKVVIYLLKRFTSMTNQEIGSEFGIGYSAVSKIARDVEGLIAGDRRIKKDVDKIISHFKV